jgi:branched-chain amino acid transport system ATP-binding protein
VNPLLRTIGLSVSFGGVHALCDVDVSIGEGELLGLIGPNGAGKTTFIDAVTGFTPSTGRVEFAGRDVTGLSAHRRARRGIARTFQSLELFDDLTVAENVAAPLERPGAMSLLHDIVRPRSIRLDTGVGAALDRLGLTDLADRLPAELSHGQRRLVACARAVAGSPALICMDEPAAGLDSTESAVLGRHLRAIATGGSAILLVDHDMSMMFDVCDRVVVIDFGRVIADGTPDEVRTDPAVVAAYLGRSMEESLEVSMEQEQP